jgi:transposase
MIPKAKQSPALQAKIAQLSRTYPKTGRAYQIVAAVDGFFNCLDRTEAEISLNALISRMRRCRLKHMKKAAETLIRHKANILAYFDCHYTNAICEGLNSMIQAAKRKVKG